MFNHWFILALVIGFALRMYDGKIISIALGLTIGVLISEVWKLLVWWLR